MATDVPPAPLPRSTSADRRQPKPSRGNFELYAWVFMRVSGVLLVLLVLGHFAIMHVLDGEGAAPGDLGGPPGHAGGAAAQRGVQRPAARDEPLGGLG